MATSSPVTPAFTRPITITPGSRILDVSHSNGRSDDSGIWKRLRDAGFDQDSIRRRDKAALIAYIAKLEAEIYDLQHNMGLLILERKDSASRYEEARLSTETVEVKHLRDQAALSSALNEAKKREENLRKAWGVEKECVKNIEKALHEMRAECAEAKVAAESKMAEARNMVEDAQQKYVEAETRLRSAESLQDEVRRSERAVGRKLQEVEAREDDLRRRLASFKSHCDAKEKDLMLERQALADRQKVLNESQKKLLDSQALLNQREADILSKSQAIKRVERELEDKKETIAAELRALSEQKSVLELNAHSISEREKAVIEKEVLLNKKEHDLLDSQKELANKEHIEIQKVLAEQEIALKLKRDEFDAELLRKQKLAEQDIDNKRRVWELRELDLKGREDFVLEKVQDLEVQSRVIADKGKDLAEKMKDVLERERCLNKSEEEFEVKLSRLEKYREEIAHRKADLQNSLLSLEVEKKQVSEAKIRLELMRSETSELLALETKLKEEIDLIRAQKQELEAEAEKLKVEKSKFEAEWEVIDEKREELRREEERIARERETISKFIKGERESLNLEKEALREQYRQDLESLSHEREAFTSESQRERSEWFTKFQQERADFLLEIECRKRELEDCVNKRRDDIESYLKEKQNAFEEEKRRELQYISSLKEDLMKEQERGALALRKLETEKVEIKLDREQRDKAWAELQNLIEELQMQRLKLKEQRELLHADREEINSQIEQLKKLEDVKVNSDTIVVPHVQQTSIESAPKVSIPAPPFEKTGNFSNAEDSQDAEGDSPPSATVSWLKKCTSLIFKPPLDDFKHVETSLNFGNEDTELGSVDRELKRIDEEIRRKHAVQAIAPIETAVLSGGFGSEEPKVIHEVPSIDEGTASLEARKDAQKTVPSSPGARKRRADSSSAPGDDSLPYDGKINKKRRQEDADAHDSSNETEHPSVADDQQLAISLSQSERGKEKWINRSVEVEEHSEDAPELVDSGTLNSQAFQSEVGKLSLVEHEAYGCIIMEQTVIEKVHIVERGEANRPDEKVACQEGATSELTGQEEDPSGTKVDKPEARQRGRMRSKSAKQKV